MKIVGKGGNSAAARKMIADERNTLERSHVPTCLVLRWEFAPHRLQQSCPERAAGGARPCTPRGPPCRSCRRECRRDPTARKWHRPSSTSNDPARALPLTTRSQVSRSASRHQVEFGARSIRSNTKCELETRSVRSSVSRVRCAPEIGRAGVRHRNCVLDVKLTLPAVIEKTKRRVAALLDLRNHEPCTDRVDRSGGHENGVARMHRAATRQDPRSSRRRWPDAIAAELTRCFRPRATLASGAALRTYQASVLPFGSPIDCAYASSG